MSLRGGRRPPWKSRSTRPDDRKAIGENAAAFPRFPRRVAPRNDKPVCLAPLNLYRNHCRSAWRSLSAATFSLARRPCATSAAAVKFGGDCVRRHSVYIGSAFPRLPRCFAPRNDNSGAVIILTEACFARQCAAGPGMPLPYSALSMSAQKFINYSASLKYAARSCIRFSSNGEVRLPSCSMARNVDSGAAYSRSLKAFRPAPGVSCSSW